MPGSSQQQTVTFLAMVCYTVAMKINYQLEMEKKISSMTGRGRLLLHSCCGPCSTCVLERLTRHFEIAVLFYNPNIRPREEYEKRLYYQEKVLREMPGDIGLIACGWQGGGFAAIAAGLEDEPEGGARCTRCFTLRLEQTAKTAKELGFPYFCTTLTISPHKDAGRINEIGAQMGRKYGIAWLPSDFKKKDGYKRSIELSARMGLYRQQYCGCGLPENAL